MVLNKPMEEWRKEFPILNELTQLQECFWVNPRKKPFAQAREGIELTLEDVLDAKARQERFAPYFMKAFPETVRLGGIIESPLREMAAMKEALSDGLKTPIKGRLLLKCDSHLPISGSIKARGGIYEILKFAEDKALESGMLSLDDDYSILTEERFRNLFSGYSVAVGSTGNLGLSIGIISAKLGFQVTVHMSADARQWKKDMLRSKGVKVIEYQGDYSQAVARGRSQAQQDPLCHFVDDENSRTLFLGYAVAGIRLKEQLKQMGICPDGSHPLFVYLPCGVGGGPGGVSFGLKQAFGDDVHCFFAEPTHSPCMMLGLVTGLHDQVSVQDFGIDNRTAADGLAVGRASRFVGRTMGPSLSGSYTVSDEHLYRLLAEVRDREGICLEPSALAGMPGPRWVTDSSQGREYLEKTGLAGKMEQAAHIVWATGGGMVPENVMEQYYRKGKELEKGKKKDEKDQ